MQHGLVRRGLFIIIEGIDGSGKSTITKMLNENAPDSWKLKTTREPGGSEVAEDIRKFILSGAAKIWGPYTEALLFTAARRDHVELLIKPHLQTGGMVVCDRFWDSTKVYQSEVSESDIDIMNQLACKNLTPDFTFYFDIPVELAVERLKQTGKTADRFESEGTSYLYMQKVKYLNQAKQNRRSCIMDASADVNVVFADVYSQISEMQKERYGDTS
jgi:dTMP kinase